MSRKTLKDVVAAVTTGRVSQRQLARTAGVSVATVNNLVHGRLTNPRVDTAEALVDAVRRLPRKASSTVKQGLRP